MDRTKQITPITLTNDLATTAEVNYDGAGAFIRLPATTVIGIYASPKRINEDAATVFLEVYVRTSADTDFTAWRHCQITSVAAGWYQLPFDIGPLKNLKIKVVTGAASIATEISQSA